jgi:hypothetical protein
MNTTNPEHPVKAAYRAGLRELRKASGRPSCRKLAAASEKLPELYPDRDLPTLSSTAISEVLNGKREGLPSASWVVSFVLCCQQLSEKVRGTKDKPDLGDVNHWLEKLQAAQDAIELDAQSASRRQASHAAGADESSGRGASLGTPDPRAHLDREVGATASEVAVGSVEPKKLPDAEREYLASYGSHGQQLLTAMEAGTPDAVYRGAILLAASSTHRDTALAQLLRAAAAEHDESIELLDASPEQSRLAPRDIAVRAMRLGDEAAAEGATAAAQAYYRCAARCDSDSPAAAVRLASFQLTEYGDLEAAALLQAAAIRADLMKLISSEPRRVAGIRPATIVAPGMLNPRADEPDSTSN